MEKITKYVPVVLVILGLFLVVQTVNALKEYRYIGGNGMGQNVISVNGEGEIFVVPDVAMFTFGVTENGKDVKTAQDAVTVKIDDAIAALKAQGIDEKDIKTVDFNANPRYEYNQIRCITVPCPSSQQLVGYDVTQTMQVKVRVADKAGDAIDAVTSAGITNVGSLSFTLDDEEEAVREARKQAIENAREKAEVLADDLGVRLVRIVSYSENNGGYPMPMYAKAQSMDSAGNAASVPSLPTGENKITVSVSVTYEIR